MQLPPFLSSLLTRPLFGFHRMKWLVFHPALAPYRVDYFNALATAVDLHVVFLEEQPASHRFDTEKLFSNCTFRYSFLLAGFAFLRKRITFGISARIRAEKPDVVVTTEYSPLTLWVVLLRRILRGRWRHVVMSDDNIHHVRGDSLSRRLRRGWTLARIDGLILCSDEVKHAYQSILGFAKPVVVIPVLHDAAIFRKWLSGARDEALAVMQDFGLQDRRIVLFVGRLAKEKRVHLIIEAFRRLQLVERGVALVIVGDGPERRSLVAQSGQLACESVHFVGSAEGPRLAAWYRLASVLVLPSSSERFGAVVGEALLAGVPVVCSREVGARSLVRQGWSGSIVEVENLEELTAEMRRWIAAGIEGKINVDAERAMLLEADLGLAVTGIGEFVSSF